MSTRSFVARATMMAGCLLAGSQRAAAIDNFWKGAAGASWNVNGNWISINGSFVPDAQGGINERAIIGTDDPAAALNGSAVLPAIASVRVTSRPVESLPVRVMLVSL